MLELTTVATRRPRPEGKHITLRRPQKMKRLRKARGKVLVPKRGRVGRIETAHISSATRLSPHELTPFAKVRGTGSSIPLER